MSKIYNIIGTVLLFLVVNINSAWTQNPVLTIDNSTHDLPFAKFKKLSISCDTKKIGKALPIWLGKIEFGQDDPIDGYEFEFSPAASEGKLQVEILDSDASLIINKSAVYGIYDFALIQHDKDLASYFVNPVIHREAWDTMHYSWTNDVAELSFVKSGKKELFRLWSYYSLTAFKELVEKQIKEGSFEKKNIHLYESVLRYKCSSELYDKIKGKPEYLYSMATATPAVSREAANEFLMSYGMDAAWPYSPE